MAVQTLTLHGMHCQACVDRISTALKQVPGVVSAHVTLNPPRAVVETNEMIAIDRFAQAVKTAGDYSITEANEVQPSLETVQGQPEPSIFPLVLIVSFIAGIDLLVTFVRDRGTLHDFLNDFMAGFFLVFAFFKFLDIRGFVQTYRSYDVIARAWEPWGFLYPFIELGLGIAFLVRWQPVIATGTTLILMLVGSVGVLRALTKKAAIRCACLGSVLNLPMTTVTLIEDLGMAVMSIVMLLWQT